MSKPIQTPLISGHYFKSVDLKIFIVSCDSLAHLMWRGYELYCNSIGRKRPAEVGDLLVVECRIARRKSVSYRVGILKSEDGQTLTLTYNCDRLNESIADWSIPLAQIKRIWTVNRVVKDYAKMNKFCPYSW
ncbi:hypothetical protein [Spirosoma harenae]